MKPTTYFALMAEFGTAHVPITDIAKKYFGHDEHKAKTTAAKGGYPFPCFRAGTQKTPWLVDIADLADYIDKIKTKAARQISTINKQQ